ncbi:hypothetical protein Tco_1131864 [Tanacetum coccineum]|uniref:Uncharacterized protein n=1 Tax=Tanacetum coccineum TaxID=301880 RepID=A0ABQ5JDD5_9ASTR
MTPESVQAMIDQALQRNSTNGDGSHSSHGDNRRNVQTARPCAAFIGDMVRIKTLGVRSYSMNLVKGNVVPQLTLTFFKELPVICIHSIVANETEKVDKYISGFLDNIYRYVKFARPKTLDETIELANDLMDQKLRTYAER